MHISRRVKDYTPGGPETTQSHSSLSAGMEKITLADFTLSPEDWRQREVARKPLLSHTCTRPVVDIDDAKRSITGSFHS